MSEAGTDPPLARPYDQDDRAALPADPPPQPSGDRTPPPVSAPAASGTGTWGTWSWGAATSISGTGPVGTRRPEGDPGVTASAAGVDPEWAPAPATPSEASDADRPDASAEEPVVPAAPAGEVGDGVVDPAETTPDDGADGEAGGAGAEPAAPPAAGSVPVSGTQHRGAFERYVVGDPGRAAFGVVTLPDAEFPTHHDVIVDGAEFGALEVRAASVRGLSHRYYGKVRQDDYGLRSSPSGDWLVVAVADGVSAGRLSHLAARVVAEHGCALLATDVDGDPPVVDWAGLLTRLSDLIVETGRDELARRADDDVTSLSTRAMADHLAATALFALVRTAPDERGGVAARVLGFGDTSAWVLRGGTAWEPLQAIKGAGEDLASSATPALPLLPPSPGAPADVTVAAGDALFLMTDGVGDPLGDGRGEVGRFLADCWGGAPPPPLQFAAQVDFARKSYDDDRTVVGIWPPAPRV